MASKAKVIGSTDPTQPETAGEEREALLHSTREQEVRNRAYAIYLQRGGQPGHELEDWLQAERQMSTNLTAVLQELLQNTNLFNDDPQDTGIAGVDIYKMDADGKAIEHWDALQLVGNPKDSAP